MCGRFQLSSTAEEVLEYFDINTPISFKQSYNITPSSYCPVIRLNGDLKEAALCHWGFIPAWAKDKKLTPINAKAETIREKPFFRTAFKKHRCIIPANGFYEWKGSKGNKQPFYFYPSNSKFFGFAGLWEVWDSPDETVESFTIITTEANSVMRPVHERMPVILTKSDYGQWLYDGNYELLKPYTNEGMLCHPVSKKVNNPEHDGAELIREV